MKHQNKNPSNLVQILDIKTEEELNKLTERSKQTTRLILKAVIFDGKTYEEAANMFETKRTRQCVFDMLVKLYYRKYKNIYNGKN